MGVVNAMPTLDSVGTTVPAYLATYRGESTKASHERGRDQWNGADGARQRSSMRTDRRGEKCVLGQLCKQPREGGNAGAVCGNAAAACWWTDGWTDASVHSIHGRVSDFCGVSGLGRSERLAE